MEQNVTNIVTSQSGLQGQITSAWPSREATEVRIHLDNGRDYQIPADLLQAQPDGSFRLLADIEDLERYQAASAGPPTEGVRIIPIVEEQLHVDKRRVTTGKVSVHKTVREHTETIDHPLAKENVQVERVAINRIIDAPAEIRQEGEVLIIPVMEELLVVDKKILLREELRITRHREETQESHEYTLRAEEVRVERENVPPSSEQQ